MRDHERLYRNMQDGCIFSAESLLKEAVRSSDVKLLILILEECWKRDWEELSAEVFRAAICIDELRMRIP